MAYFELAPDWVCEVPSPSTEAMDRTEKSDIYAETGVQWMWLVNPTTRTLEVSRLSDGRWVRQATHRDDAKVAAPPFDAIAIALADLWLEASE